ncbi:DUF4397 domain-containing protein [Paraflavitalea pollutisoli]|uniref:DUF4397 domain-containing protein n=1 Tax=Paraflavitalea pollutisoli TaxID=3034143 RepID=UPI0023EAC5DA|nr:DUF4397 domain-containing protein [Paraflavitalea sp. H1-2-19X]
MNKALSYLRRSLVPVLAVVSAGVLLTACLKDKDYDNTPIPAAGLMTFNLAPDQSNLLVRLSGNLLTQQPLGYTNYSGVYQNIYVGDRQIEAFNYNAGKTLTSSSYKFEDGKYYSLFVTGVDSAYRNIVAVDDFGKLDSTSSTGKAYVRYINAITDTVNASTVTIAAGGNNIVNESAAYGKVNEFTEATAGNVVVTVKNNNGVDATRTISLEANKVYTVLLLGKPGATDAAKQVQIKFVANGLLTDDNK